MVRRKKSRAGPIISLFIAGIFLAGAGIIAIRQGWKEQQFDEDFCPRNGIYPRTAILIDASDQLSTNQQKTISEYLRNQLRHDLLPREWIGIFLLNNYNIVLPKKEFSVCYPGDASSANPLIENPATREQIFQTKFLAPLDNALIKLATTSTQETSPIFEMIEAVSLAHDFDSTQPRRLVIVSDMLHNVTDYSHYDQRLDLDTFRQTAYAQRFFNVSLTDVDVTILYLQRAATLPFQTTGHIKFWQDYFATTGAKLVRVEPIR